jgi:hypothetical protein
MWENETQLLIDLYYPFVGSVMPPTQDYYNYDGLLPMWWG